MSKIFPNKKRIEEKIKMLKQRVFLNKKKKIELEDISEKIDNLRKRLTFISEKKDNLRKNIDYLEETLKNLDYFVKYFASDTPLSKFNEEYFNFRNKFGSITDIEDKIETKLEELETALNEYENKIKKISNNQKRIEKLDREIKFTSKFLIKEKEAKKIEIEKLKKKNIELKELLDNDKDNIEKLKEELEFLKRFNFYKFWENYLIRLAKEEGKDINKMSDNDFIELIRYLKTKYKTLKEEKTKIIKEETKINKNLKLSNEKMKNFKKLLSDKIEEKNSRNNSIRILKNYFMRMREIGKESTALNLATYLSEDLEKKGYELLDIAPKTIGKDIGVFVALYNTKKNKYKELIVKLETIESERDRMNKIAENIDFEILGKSTSIKQNLSITDNGKLAITSSKIISDNCENLTDFYSNIKNRNLFIKNKTLNTSMFDILTGAIAINAKDVRGDNIVIDLTDPDNLRAYNIDIQPIDYWKSDIKNFPYDLDVIPTTKKLIEHKNDFGITIFSNKNNLTQTVFELFFEGETHNGVADTGFAAVYREGENSEKPLFDAFRLIALQPDADEKLKESFERTAISLMKKYDEYNEKCKNCIKEHNFGEEYRRAIVAFNKTREAINRYIKLNDIIKYNCEKELFNQEILSKMRSKITELVRA